MPRSSRGARAPSFDDGPQLSTKLVLFLILPLIGIAMAMTQELRRPSPVSTADLPLNKDVTPASLAKTICVVGWARSVRPKPAVMRALKLQKLRAAGLGPEDARRFELDHLIPITLGGALADPRNLALQPWPEAREKDDVELCLSLAVCADQLPLSTAQRAVWRDWHKAEALCH